jgi:hypothetical protein
MRVPPQLLLLGSSSAWPAVVECRTRRSGWITLRLSAGGSLTFAGSLLMATEDLSMQPVHEASAVLHPDVHGGTGLCELCTEDRLPVRPQGHHSSTGEACKTFRVRRLLLACTIDIPAVN